METQLIIKDGASELKFEVTRLKPSEQFKLILKVIGLIAKGSTQSKRVEQLLHNQLGTGVEIDGLETSQEANVMAQLFDAIKGAISTLTDADRDALITELLRNVHIVVTPELKYQASLDQLDKRCSSFVPIMKLLVEVAKINFLPSSPASE